MVEVEIPATIRAAVGSPAQVAVEGLSVREVLESLSVTYPPMRPRLIGEDGKLHRFVNVYVNGIDIRQLDGDATRLIGKERVQILSAISGG